MTSSNLWVAAGNTDSANIMVIVTDGTNKAIGNASIVLSVTQPWSLQDTMGTTPAGGQFVTRFLPTTTAGTAVITATVTVPGTTTVPVVQTISQNIIADLPTKATKSYTSTASVGSITDITIRVTDQYGNPVSSKKKKNTVTLTTSGTGDNGFLAQASSTNVGGKVKGLSVALNDSGYADVDFALNTRPGENFVIIDPPDPLPWTLLSIQGIANLPPSSITQTVTPGGKPPTLTTDGLSKCTINYLLSDKFGNPSIGRTLSIFTTAGERRVISTNNEGKVTISYGPKTGPGRYTITAQSQDNPKVSAVQTVQFLSGKPTGISFTASPQTMASGEVDGSVTALVMAKVIDSLGNPVTQQTVYFSIQNVNTGSFIKTKGPSIKGDKDQTDQIGKEVSAVTDESGYAIGTFTPGSFTADTDNPGFSLMAEGVARVRARWTGKYMDLNLSYKNFPYLSVSSSADPNTVDANGTLDVSIKVRGDGYALKPKPVDAYMVTDRSKSMSSGDPSRMDLVKNAATTFKDQFDYSVDRLGQFSFGDDTYYSDDVTLDLALTDQPAQIQNAISTLTPSGHTPMRNALYRAINELAKYKTSDSVKGLVVLSDGDYNWYGDPLARGGACWSCDKYKSDGTCFPGHTVPCSLDSFDTGTQSYYSFPDLSSPDQNMSQYARDNKIRIYAIGYSTDISTDGQKTLRALAETTYGKYYYALTPDDLFNFYGQIAGALKDTAGVNTTLALDFSSVGVNGVPVTPGSKVLQYVYIDGRSTRVTHPDGTWETLNSTADWNKGKINVSMGTIKVNQEWLVNFTLNVTMAGNIRLISSSSKLYFNDNQGSATSVPAPDTFVTAIPGGTDKGLGTPKLEIKNLQRTNSDEDRENAVLVWDIIYDGKDPDIREEIEVAPLNSDAYSYQGITFAANGDTSDTYTIDISDLMPGTYKAKVTGFVDDAGSSFNITQFSIPMDVPTPKIFIH